MTVPPRTSLLSCSSSNRWTLDSRMLPRAGQFPILSFGGASPSGAAPLGASKSAGSYRGPEMTVLEIPDRFNAASFFVDRHVQEGRGGKTAFFCDDAEITYSQLQEMVNRAGNALRELGVEAEQRVLCLLLDSPAFLATFWGAIKIGAIPIPINTMMRSQDYLYFLNDSRAKVAVISEALLAEAGAILSQATHLKHV